MALALAAPLTTQLGAHRMSDLPQPRTITEFRDWIAAAERQRDRSVRQVEAICRAIEFAVYLGVVVLIGAALWRAGVFTCG